MIKNGHYHTYQIWVAMRQRCNNPRSKDWENYGGRGIKICKEWGLYANFLADMGERPFGLTLERKNNHKGYCKSNCEWVNRTQQNRNRRSSKLTVDQVEEIRVRYVRYHNRWSNRAALAEEFGVSPSTVKKIVCNEIWL